jgi:hypothetical protein
VESLLTAPRATATEAAPFVGVWEGEARQGEHHVTAFTLTIRIENGRAAGHVTWKVGPDEELVQELQHFTVQPRGFTYGFMNGMRPRGMLMYPMTVTREGTAEGSMRWGGIVPPRHEGEGPPEKVTLRLRKRDLPAGHAPLDPHDR